MADNGKEVGSISPGRKQIMIKPRTLDSQKENLDHANDIAIHNSKIYLKNILIELKNKNSMSHAFRFLDDYFDDSLDFCFKLMFKNAKEFNAYKASRDHMQKFTIGDINDLDEKEIIARKSFNKILDNFSATTKGEKIKYSKHNIQMHKIFKYSKVERDVLQLLLDGLILSEVHSTGPHRKVIRGMFSYTINYFLYKSDEMQAISVLIGETVKNSTINHLHETSLRETTNEMYMQYSSVSNRWFVISDMFKKLIFQGSDIDFDGVVNIFKNDFNRKLKYDSFKDLDFVPIVEKIINQALVDNSQGTNILFYGQAGTGKTEMVYAMAEKNDWILISIGEDDNDSSPKGRLDTLFKAQSFFGAFDKKVVFLFDEMEDILNLDNKQFGKLFINRIIENTPFPIFWTSNNVYRFDQSILRRMTFASKFDLPDKKKRKELWTKYKNESNLNIDDSTIDEYSKNYPVAHSVIGSVSNAVSNSKLNSDETKIMIKNLMSAYNHGDDVEIKNKDGYIGQYTNFDFRLIKADVDLERLADRLISSSNNNWTACLHGAPGTGKSAFGRYIAQKLNIPVICKRVSDLQSMWVGQTEKNIAEAFKEAEDDGALLIFDEADSFLQSRSNAKNSWEVSQVNELLCQMENSKVRFLCSTNLMSNLDEASLRRFVFKISFSWLTPEQMNLACKIFFNQDMTVNRKLTLSPGDFVSVKKRLDITGYEDVSEIYDLLEQESKLKHYGKGGPIGF